MRFKLDLEILLATVLFTTIAVAQTPSPLPEITPDPGYCGLYPLETGPYDPFWKVCKRHDDSFNANKDGLPGPGYLSTTTDFVQGVAITAAQGVYSTIMAVPYIVFGTVVGGGLWFGRWVKRKRQSKTTKAKK